MAPFIQCDPIAGVTQYQITIVPPSGPTTTAQFPAQADGSARFDAAGLSAVGKYTFTLSNADASGFWSAASSPLSGTRYTPPANLRFV